MGSGAKNPPVEDSSTRQREEMKRGKLVFVGEAAVDISTSLSPQEAVFTGEKRRLSRDIEFPRRKNLQIGILAEVDGRSQSCNFSLVTNVDRMIGARNFVTNRSMDGLMVFAVAKRSVIFVTMRLKYQTELHIHS